MCCIARTWATPVNKMNVPTFKGFIDEIMFKTCVKTYRAESPLGETPQV